MYTLCTLILLGPAGPPSHPWVLETGLTAEQLRARTATLRTAGYRPVCVCGYNVAEDSRFAGVWEKSSGPAWSLEAGLTPAAFDRRAAEMKKAGYRPVVLSGYDLVGAQGFVDLWHQATGPAWEADYGLDSGLLRQAAQAMKEKGYRPRSVSSYVSGSISRYTVLWEQQSATWELRWGLSATALDEASTELTALGYRPVAVAGLGVEEQQSFTAAWVKRAGPAWQMRYNLDAGGLADLARTMRSRGYRPVYLAGYTTLAGPRFASIWEETRGEAGSVKRR